MPSRRIAITVITLWISASVAAQSPYAGWQARTIKALSAEQIDDLRAGRGMSLALPAELNGHPGPKHALELATELALTATQKTAIEKLYATMQSEAQAAGSDVLASESSLDELFTAPALSADAIERAVIAASNAWGRLRWVHLKNHLRMRELLSSEQISRYNQLRGYAQHQHQHKHSH